MMCCTIKRQSFYKAKESQSWRRTLTLMSLSYDDLQSNYTRTTPSWHCYNTAQNAYDYPLQPFWNHPWGISYQPLAIRETKTIKAILGNCLNSFFHFLDERNRQRTLVLKPTQPFKRAMINQQTPSRPWSFPGSIWNCHLMEHARQAKSTIQEDQLYPCGWWPFSSMDPWYDSIQWWKTSSIC